MTVADDVFDGVLFCAVLFSPRDVLDELWDLIESVPENFLPTFANNTKCRRISRILNTAEPQLYFNVR